MKTTSAVVCIRCSKPTSGGIYICDAKGMNGPYCPTCAQILMGAIAKEPSRKQS